MFVSLVFTHISRACVHVCVGRFNLAPIFSAYTYVTRFHLTHTCCACPSVATARLPWRTFLMVARPALFTRCAFIFSRTRWPRGRTHDKPARYLRRALAKSVTHNAVPAVRYFAVGPPAHQSSSRHTVALEHQLLIDHVDTFATSVHKVAVTWCTGRHEQHHGRHDVITYGV